MKGEMDGKMFASRKSWHLSVVDSMNNLLFTIRTLTWRVNDYVSRQGKGINRRNGSINNIMIYNVETAVYPLYLS